MNCPDICTAQKCRELEARIGELEQALALIEASFEAHTQQEIPQAHQYNPHLRVSAGIGNEYLIIDVELDSANDSATVELPSIDTFVTFDIFPLANNQYLFKVQVNGKGDQDILTLPQSNLNLDGIFQDNNLYLTVADGESQDTAIINITLPEPTEHIESNLKISASYLYDILTITVADGESQDTTQVYIDADVINNYGGGSSDVSCDQFSQELQDCCAEIIAAISNVSNQVQQVENEITIDISGTVNSDYQCIENQETKVIEPSLTEVSYSGRGIRGIHENLKILSTNLDSIFQPLCDLDNQIDVVSIVANDRIVAAATGKYLVLHFVTENNYPKRNRNSTYWEVNIPAAKDSYDWEDDFLDLRFYRGNQYAELRFNEFRSPVSGFFNSKSAANDYFDRVLTLTTATEKQRVYPEHKPPLTNVASRITRPTEPFLNR